MKHGVFVYYKTLQVYIPCTPRQKSMFESVIGLVIVGGLVTGLLRHAMVQMGETEPMSSDNFWVRAPAATAYMACLFTGGYLVYVLLQVLIQLVGG